MRAVNFITLSYLCLRKIERFTSQLANRFLFPDFENEKRNAIYALPKTQCTDNIPSGYFVSGFTTAIARHGQPGPRCPTPIRYQGASAIASNCSRELSRF